MKVRTNTRTDCWCLECKERIELGEKYIVLQDEIYDGTIIDKSYHVGCAPEETEDEEPYISESELGEDEIPGDQESLG